MKLTTIEVKGKKFAVEVTDEGQFQVFNNGDSTEASSLVELKTKLAAKMSRSKLKLNIPFVRWEEAGWRTGKTGSLRRGTITGLHGSNRNVLVKFEGEKSGEQDSSWRDGGFIDPMFAEELERLGKAKTKAEQEFEAFVAEHKFNAKDAVRQALGAEAEEAGL